MKALAKAIRARADVMTEADEVSHFDHQTAEQLYALARLLEGKSSARAFGAPGDWGYGTPIGDALMASLQEPLPPATGAELVEAERRRQIEKEGWSADHDDQLHRSGELNDAAVSYAMAAARQARGENLEYLKSAAAAGEFPWPWEDEWWKPSPDRVRNLVKAGALIVAEIDRVQRKVAAAETQPEGTAQ